MLIETEKITLTIPAVPANFNMLYPFFERLQSIYAISADMAANIELVVGEAVNNAIIHGNGGNEKKMVTVVAENNCDGIQLTIADEGNGFDYNNLADPTLPENIESPTGRGVFLIKQLADEVEYLNNGSTIIVRFKL